MLPFVEAFVGGCYSSNTLHLSSAATGIKRITMGKKGCFTLLDGMHVMVPQQWHTAGKISFVMNAPFGKAKERVLLYVVPSPKRLRFTTRPETGGVARSGATHRSIFRPGARTDTSSLRNLSPVPEQCAAGK